MEIIHGDCLEEMKKIPDESVDAIVTDPPYELGFMGKKWDSTGIAYNVELWQECLRVLKPGGHLLAFGGTRTYHRMAVAIEDAGFEVRDMLEWIYACLSIDTEVLTERGYKHLHKITQYDRIMVYDIQKDIYKWEKPTRWNIYQVNNDTAYHIQSDYTDQIVSRNHRCLVEREGKLVFLQAEELNEMEYMPTLPSDFYTLQTINGKLLFKTMLWKGKGLVKTLFRKWKGQEVSSEGIENGKKSCLERWSNLFQKTRKLQTNKVCSVSEAVFEDGTKRRLCDGTSFDYGSLNSALPVEDRSGASYQSQPTGQPLGEFNAFQDQQGTQIIRRENAKITKIKYSGLIFCPTVSTGAFVARRNGKIFITGNSGFPKSLNVGKAVDKIQGNEREEFVRNDGAGTSVSGKKTIYGSGLSKADNDTSEFIDTKGTSEWEGWGTSLKPSHEPVICCAKPLTIELIFAKMGIDITNEIINLCQKYNVNVKDAESSLNSIHLKLEKVGANTVAENARMCDWENIESAVIAGMSFTSPKPISKEQPEGYKVVSAPISANQNGKEYLQESGTLIGTAEDLNEQMDILLSKLTTGDIDLNIVWLWKSILENVLQKAGTFTTSMALKTTIAWKTYKSLLSANTQNFTSKHNSTSPSHEPICMARKPLAEKTVAENCLKYGTGGINVDESRVIYSETNKPIPQLAQNKREIKTNNGMYGGNSFNESKTKSTIGGSLDGRFPANLIHDNSEEVRECFPNESERFFKSIIYQAKSSKSDRNKGLDGYLTVKYNGCIINNNKTLCKEENMVAVQLLQKVISEQELVSFNIDESGVNIMVQCHKDSLSIILTEINRIIGLKIYSSLMHSLTNESTQVVNSEMEAGGNLAESVVDLKRWILTTTKGNQELALGASRVVYEMLQLISVEENWKEKTNTHSTVKPIALMEYLIKMVTPKGGTVLDPFMGSGSTGVACVKNGYTFIGIEMEEEYIKIAKARIGE